MLLVSHENKAPRAWQGLARGVEEIYKVSIMARNTVNNLCSQILSYLFLMDENADGASEITSSLFLSPGL